MRHEFSFDLKCDYCYYFSKELKIRFSKISANIIFNVVNHSPTSFLNQPRYQTCFFNSAVSAQLNFDAKYLRQNDSLEYRAGMK